jgi:hypothetical protein
MVDYGAYARAESDIEGIGRLLDEGPEDLPHTNEKLVIPVVVRADVHQPDEATLSTARNRKCGSKPAAVELLIVLLAGWMPVLPIRRHLGELRFQMSIARIIPTRADCVVRWHDPPLLEIVADPMFRMCRIFSFFQRKADVKHESVSKSAAFFAAQSE